MKRVRYDSYTMGDLASSLDNYEEDSSIKKIDILFEKIIKNEKNIEILAENISSLEKSINELISHIRQTKKDEMSKETSYIS